MHWNAGGIAAAVSTSLPTPKRFIVELTPNRTPGSQPVSQQINVVSNWFEDLKQRVPVH